MGEDVMEVTIVVNWWPVVIIAYWISAGIACLGVKDSVPISVAFIATIITGIAYLILS